jgi:hypothetical protein
VPLCIDPITTGSTNSENVPGEAGGGIEKRKRGSKVARSQPTEKWALYYYRRELEHTRFELVL